MNATPDFSALGYKYLGTNPYEAPKETGFVNTGRCLRLCWNDWTREYWNEDSSD